MAVIVQMFNLPFKKVQGKLPTMAKYGVSHLLVSPPQKSNPSRSWWGRYQPVDFQIIEGPLGSGGDLFQLCQKSRQKGISILADAVLNHMTNHPHYVGMRGSRVHYSNLPRFREWDFHSPETRTAYGRVPLGGGGKHALPELRTDLPYVQNELLTYLMGLAHLGVAGFRFDAARHIAPQFFKKVAPTFPGFLNFGELVFGNARDYSSDLLNSIRATDFPFAATLKRAFSWHGNLQTLLGAESHGNALWGPHSIKFANHHDFARRGGGFKEFKITDPTDRILANSFILGHSEGIPLLYYNDLKLAWVKKGLTLRSKRRGNQTQTYFAQPNFLVWSSGENTLWGINKSGETLSLPPFKTQLWPGIYLAEKLPPFKVDINRIAYGVHVHARSPLLGLWVRPL